MHQHLPRLPAFERELQCSADLLGVQAVVHVMAHELARPCISDQAEIDEPWSVSKYVVSAAHTCSLAVART